MSWQRPATTKNISGKMKQIGVVLIIACYRALATDDEKQTERLQSVHRGERSDTEKDKKRS